MSSLIEEIQRDALDQSVSVSTLLRKVKFSAAKLGLENVEDWVDEELNGYDKALPSYRILSGQPMARNPIRGWEPVGGAIEVLSKRGNGSSVSAIEHLLREADGQLMVGYPDSIVKQLNTANGINWGEYALFIDRSELAAILDRVRTMVLDWAIKMEKAGVVGAEFTFAPAEVERAKDVPVTIKIGTIGQFAGNLGHGNTSGSVALSDSPEMLRSFAEQISTHQRDLILAGADAGALQKSVSDLQAEVSKSSPSQDRLRGLLGDIRNAVSGATGNLIASGVLASISHFLR